MVPRSRHRWPRNRRQGLSASFWKDQRGQISSGQPRPTRNRRSIPPLAVVRDPPSRPASRPGPAGSCCRSPKTYWLDRPGRLTDRAEWRTVPLHSPGDNAAQSYRMSRVMKTARRAARRTCHGVFLHQLGSQTKPRRPTAKQSAVSPESAPESISFDPSLLPCAPARVHSKGVCSLRANPAWLPALGENGSRKGLFPESCRPKCGPDSMPGLVPCFERSTASGSQP